MTRRTVTIALTVLALLVLTVSPALADHPHHMVTPNGECHQVARGQTAIADLDHGGWHRFHRNIHLVAKDNGDRLGNSAVLVTGGLCPTP